MDNFFKKIAMTMLNEELKGISPEVKLEMVRQIIQMMRDEFLKSDYNTHGNGD